MQWDDKTAKMILKLLPRARVALLGALFLVGAAPALAKQYSALVVEPESGRILFERDADGLRHPASVTKMMTLYLVFEALDRGEVTLDTPLEVSRNAVLRPPSRLGVRPGDTLRVEDAILALVTRSANDAATVIAENLGGTESAFAEMMTAKARALGMRDSVFRNASGLPDPAQWTTARDMYRLGRALINDFPRYYPYFSTPQFYYRGQSFANHNHLMETYPGMDGIKTGFINASGFNLVASAKRGGRRLIGVVFGGPSAVRRDRHMREILDDGFSQLAGAPPRAVSAEFEYEAAPRATREPIEIDAPRLIQRHARVRHSKQESRGTSSTRSAPPKTTQARDKSAKTVASSRKSSRSSSSTSCPETKRSGERCGSAH